MSAVYPLFREQLLDWALNANAPAGLAFYMIGVTSGYVYNAAHTSLDDVSGATIVMPEQALASVTIAGGVVDAADVEYTGLTEGNIVNAFVIYMKDGAADSYLAVYIDTASDESLPQTLDSSAMTVRWNASGIFRV